MWRHARNNVTTMAAIDPEIGIGGEHERIRQRFGHANEAGVGEAHRYIGVLLHELQHGLNVLCQFERNEHGTPAKQAPSVDAPAAPTR